MKMFLSIALVLLCGSCFGQVEINGKVPGQLWRTERVSGEAEFFHCAGARIVAKPKDAWVNIEKDRITIGARTDKKDFDFEDLTGKFECGGTVVLTNKADHMLGMLDVRATQTAIVYIDSDGFPVAMTYTLTEHIDYGVRDYMKQFQRDASPWADRLRHELQGFDANGYRYRTFNASFQPEPDNNDDYRKADKRDIGKAVKFKNDGDVWVDGFLADYHEGREYPYTDVLRAFWKYARVK